MRFLSDQAAEELIQEIERMMYHWHLNPQGADHRCEFCGAEADKNYGELTHHSDCSGLRMLDNLKNSHDAARAGREPAPQPPTKPTIES